MKCLALDEVMMKMADFDVGVCSRAEIFVNDQHLDKAIRKVLETFDGVGFTNGIREIIAISINSWNLC